MQQNHLYNAELQSVKGAKHLENTTTQGMLSKFCEDFEKVLPTKGDKQQVLS